MDSIYNLFSFLFNFTLVGAGLFFLIKFLQFHSNLKVRNELQRLQARISILRMNLKAKVKKRANTFRSYYAKSIAPNEILDKDLSSLLELNFETGHDFQDYFDMTQGLHTLIEAIHKDPETPVQKYQESDAKAEHIIFHIVKQIHDASIGYNEKVEHYNRINPKNKINKIDPIEFNSMMEIEHILNSQINTENIDLSSEEKLDAA